MHFKKKFIMNKKVTVSYEPHMAYYAKQSFLLKHLDKYKGYYKIPIILWFMMCNFFSTGSSHIEEQSHNLGAILGRSHSVTTWSRDISLSERQPHSAIVSSNSSRSISSTFLTPASPSAANENTTGLPI
jgi:hypothetical protein